MRPITWRVYSDGCALLRSLILPVHVGETFTGKGECWRDRLSCGISNWQGGGTRRTYNPEDRRSKQPITKESAMSELAAAVSSTKPDNFTPTIITKTDDYLYAEYQSPTFGFIDDVEFYFPSGKSTVEYRSASRIGESDGARGPCMPCGKVLMC